MMRVSPGSAFPSRLPLVSAMVTAAGLALSRGAVAANELRLPVASRAPVVLEDIATVIVPTVVSAAPAPSLSVRVSVADDRLTDDSVPLEGTLVRVHGFVPAV